MAWVPFDGFINGSFPLKAKSIDTQRTINMFPEVLQSGSAKNSKRSYFKSVPGLELLSDLGGANPPKIRLVYPSKKHNGFYVVANDDLYLFKKSGGTWGATFFSGAVRFETTSGPLSAAASLVGDDEYIVFADGSNNYVARYIASPESISFNKFATLGYVGVPTATHVKFVDGYFIFNKKDTNQFFVSDWNSLSVDALSFASAEGDQDNIEAVEVLNRNVIFFNEQSTEIWYNSGNADFPFERTSGGFFEMGILAKFSVAKDDKRVFWLARSKLGQAEIYAMSGLNPEKISTHALEEKITSYASPQNATAYCYQMEGHSFYVISFDEGTWAYDTSTGIWSERGILVNGDLTRELISSYCFLPGHNLHVVGSRLDGRIYYFNNDSNYFGAYSLGQLVVDGPIEYQDFTIPRERWYPHVSADGNRMICHALKIEMVVGVGRAISSDDPGIVSAANDPKAMLSWSDDGGYTWSQERIESIGKVGERNTRVIFWRLGSYRDRVYKLRFTDSIPVTILSCEIQFEVGAF